MPDEERKRLTVAEAERVLKKGAMVHCFLNPGGMLVGADWERAEVLDCLRRAPAIELTGDMARRMGHGIVALNPGDPHFFATDEAALKAFESTPAESSSAPMKPRTRTRRSARRPKS